METDETVKELNTNDNTLVTTVIEEPEISTGNENISKSNVAEKQKLFQLPLGRVKAIMKMDPDSQIISKEALFITTKATELFLHCLSKEMFEYTRMGKRKMIVKRDLDNAIDNVSSLCFLEGSLEQLL